MDDRNFYDETKWCTNCQEEVRYLMSVNHSYCVQCGSRVRLFNPDEQAEFADEVQKKKFRFV